LVLATQPARLRGVPLSAAVQLVGAKVVLVVDEVVVEVVDVVVDEVVVGEVVVVT
jgi:hypothetical protein